MCESLPAVKTGYKGGSLYWKPDALCGVIEINSLSTQWIPFLSVKVSFYSVHLLPIQVTKLLKKRRDRSRKLDLKSKLNTTYTFS